MYVLFFFKTCFACGKGQAARILRAVGRCPCRDLLLLFDAMLSPVSRRAFALCRKAYAETLFLRPKAAAIRLVTAPVRMF